MRPPFFRDQHPVQIRQEINGGFSGFGDLLDLLLDLGRFRHQQDIAR